MFVPHELDYEFSPTRPRTPSPFLPAVTVCFPVGGGLSHVADLDLLPVFPPVCLPTEVEDAEDDEDEEEDGSDDGEHDVEETLSSYGASGNDNDDVL